MRIRSGPSTACEELAVVRKGEHVHVLRMLRRTHEASAGDESGDWLLLHPARYGRCHDRCFPLLLRLLLLLPLSLLCTSCLCTSCFR